MGTPNPWADLRAAVRTRLVGQVPELTDSCETWNGEEDERLYRLARTHGAAAWIRVRAARAVAGSPRAKDSVDAEIEILAVAASTATRADAAEGAEALSWRIRSALRGHTPVSWATNDGCAFASQTVLSSSPSAHAVQLLFTLTLHLAQWATS